MEFRKALDALFDEECKRARGNIANLYKLLEEARVTPEDIDKACCAELIRINDLRYEIIQKTDRADGLGWSSSKMTEHMDRFLKTKISDMCSVMRRIAHKEQPAPMNDA
jgi:hypothetical protein